MELQIEKEMKRLVAVGMAAVRFYSVEQFDETGESAECQQAAAIPISN